MNDLPTEPITAEMVEMNRELIAAADGTGEGYMSESAEQPTEVRYSPPRYCPWCGSHVERHGHDDNCERPHDTASQIQKLTEENERLTFSDRQLGILQGQMQVAQRMIADATAERDWMRDVVSASIEWDEAMSEERIEAIPIQSFVCTHCGRVRPATPADRRNATHCDKCDYAMIACYDSDMLIERLLAAETQRDTLRTALIEAQSWIEGAVITPKPGGRLEHLIARIREALEGTA